MIKGKIDAPVNMSSGGATGGFGGVNTPHFLKRW